MIFIGILSLLSPIRAQPTFTLPELVSFPGETLDVPITIENVPVDSDIFAMQFEISYDPGIIRANSLSFDQLVFRSSSEWEVEFNISEGLISFAFAGTGSIESDGVIANIRYIVSESAVNLDSSPLNFSNLFVNEGSPSVTSRDGKVEIFIVAVENEAESEALPLTMRLHQNYPNPFNPSTTIRYAIYKSGNVVLTIHDILGHEIDRLVDLRQPAGNYAVNWFGEEFTSGVYFYRFLLTNDGDRFTSTKKMLLVK